MVTGLLILGATTLTSEGAFSDPVWLAAGTIDASILDGTLQAGALNNVSVNPPVSEWPDRWKFLKENE